MTLVEVSKREHCPACDATQMSNFVHVRPGNDVEVYVECAACKTFVARYTLRAYTCEDPYRSYLRFMRRRRMSSGAAAHKKADEYVKELWDGYARAKELAQAWEEERSVEELLDGAD